MKVHGGLTGHGPLEGPSIRNQLPGTVTGSTAGDAMASVRVTAEGAS
jgi:molybdate transport system regulatory protein